MSFLIAQCCLLATLLIQPGAAAACADCMNKCNQAGPYPGLGTFHWAEHKTNSLWLKWDVGGTMMYVEDPNESSTVGPPTLRNMCNCLNISASLCGEPMYFMQTSEIPNDNLLFKGHFQQDGFLLCTNAMCNYLTTTYTTSPAIGNAISNETATTSTATSATATTSTATTSTATPYYAVPIPAKACSACMKQEECKSVPFMPGLTFHWSQHTNQRWIKWHGEGTFLLVEEGDENSMDGKMTLNDTCSCLFDAGADICTAPTYWFLADSVPNEPAFSMFKLANLKDGFLKCINPDLCSFIWAGTITATSSTATTSIITTTRTTTFPQDTNKVSASCTVACGNSCDTFEENFDATKACNEYLKQNNYPGVSCPDLQAEFTKGSRRLFPGRWLSSSRKVTVTSPPLSVAIASEAHMAVSSQTPLSAQNVMSAGVANTPASSISFTVSNIVASVESPPIAAAGNQNGNLNQEVSAAVGSEAASALLLALLLGLS